MSVRARIERSTLINGRPTDEELAIIAEAHNDPGLAEYLRNRRPRRRGGIETLGDVPPAVIKRAVALGRKAVAGFKTGVK